MRQLTTKSTHTATHLPYRTSFRSEDIDGDAADVVARQPQLARRVEQRAADLAADHRGAHLDRAFDHLLRDLVAVDVDLDAVDVVAVVAERAQRRSEERREGNECVSTCRSRWSPYHYK